ncbi:MAG TPA: hypothetical protein EYO84_08530 [Planctomycetes bacterium]|nr:hypothetical protein [Planctomycetota bacterium]
MQPSAIRSTSRLVVVSVLLVTVSGCWGDSADSVKPRTRPQDHHSIQSTAAPEQQSGAPGALRRADLPELTAEVIADAENLVMGSCSRCHAPLPPDALPRRAWEKAILAMDGLVDEWGQVGATTEEIAIALHYYEKEAPEELEYDQNLPEQDLYFETVELTPSGLESERIPAVSDLLMLGGDRGRSEGILVSELRSRRLMFLPYGALEATELVPYMGSIDFNYPASLSHVDFDGKGKLDILVSSIGGMNPSNEVEGGAWIIARSDRKMAAFQVGGALARACALEGADFDGDGDIDLVSCAFGFRGPGRLVWLENIGGRFIPRELDKRDGFVATVLEDIDGDGDIDIVALLSQHHELLMQFTNMGDGVFEPKVLLSFPHAAWGSSDLMGVDIDQDGDRDLIIVNGDTLDDNTPKPIHGVRWLERSGDQYTTLHEILLLPGCERAAVGDLDGDGDLDVVGAAFFPQLPPDDWQRWDSVVWAQNLGDAKSWQVRTLEVGNPVHSAVLLDDVDRDGKVDVILGNYVWLRPAGAPSARRDYLTILRRTN